MTTAAVRPVAALFVLPDGPYTGQPGVDPWDEARDARRYDGPWPVVAHPPCERWGAFAYGSPGAQDFLKGQDGGCFAAALSAVRRFGGVLEHPTNSYAWRVFKLPRPNRDGSWGIADSYGGRCCRVEQGNYGHSARKATWLYAVGVDFRPLLWHESARPFNPADHGISAEEWRMASKPPGRLTPEQRYRRREILAVHERVTGKRYLCVELMESKRERKLTPLPFRDLLIDLARSCDWRQR